MAYQSQDPRRRRRRRRRKQNNVPLFLIPLAFVAALILLAIVLRVALGGSKPAPAPKETTAPTIVETVPETQPEEKEEKESFWSRLFGKKEKEPEAETEPPEPEHEVAAATILATGDILMHKPVFNAYLTGSGNYDFTPMFRYIQSYVNRADYAAANLETTLAGTDNGYPFSGYPAFNCPDEIVDGLKNNGFDLLLTANNHCYDTSEVGFLRTVRTIRSKGLDNLGTMAAADDPKYIIKDLNGIRVGMVCYTYEAPPADPVPGIIYMNQNAMSPSTSGLINSFSSTDLEGFYQELNGVLGDMRSSGAEATVVFIHWGVEYTTVPTGEQRDMAQRICDMGVDVIVGGHPHVVQPVDMLTSRTDPEHKTVCLYSMGNAVSNQRVSEMDLKTGHTEDGVLFSFTFSKYSDDTVYLDKVDLIPCWVDLRVDNTIEYNILPLDPAIKDNWRSLYYLSDITLEKAEESYTRTMDIVGGGLSRAQEFLAERKEQRDADYVAAVSPTEAAA